MAPTAASKAAASIGKAKTAAQTAGAAAAGAAVKLDRKTGKAAQGVLRTPRAQARRTVRGASELFWRVMLALICLSIFALVLRSATKAPQRIDQLTQTLPNAFQKFVNPFEEKKK